MNKIVKMHKESILSFNEKGRPELAEDEQAQCDVITSYLPQQLSAEEVSQLIEDAIAKVGATNVKDMGKVCRAYLCSVDFRSAYPLFTIALIHFSIELAYIGDGGTEAPDHGESRHNSSGRYHTRKAGWEIASLVQGSECSVL